MGLSKLMTLSVLAIAVTLASASIPSDAEAQLCKIIKPKVNGKKQKRNCVTSGDVKNESLTVDQVRDIAKAERLFGVKDFLSTLEPGLVLVTASAKIDATGLPGPVSVRCTITPGKTANPQTPHTIVESLNPTEDVPFASIVATKVFNVSKGLFMVKFSCKKIAGRSPKIQRPGVSARYVATNY